MTSVCSRVPGRVRRSVGRGGAARELSIIAGTYAGYSVARRFASDDATQAAQHARHLRTFEHFLGLDVEATANAWASHHLLLEVVSSYWYCTAHYLVTPLVLFWLWRRRPDIYPRARNVLIGSTLIALVMYLAIPMTPPRLLSGYVDVLARTSHWGWWGAQASAPRGLGGSTNQLAAMPSMHVGWAVWVALVAGWSSRRRWLPRLVWLYPLGTTVVVVLTANHWVMDVVAGAALVVAVSWWLRWVSLLTESEQPAVVMAPSDPEEVVRDAA